MNSDYAACIGTDCEKKHECKRYKLHLHHKKNHAQSKWGQIYLNPQECIKWNYSLFERKNDAD